MLIEGVIEPDGKSSLEIWKDEEIYREKLFMTQHCNWLSENNIAVTYKTLTPFCRQFSNLLKSKQIIEYEYV